MHRGQLCGPVILLLCLRLVHSAPGKALIPHGIAWGWGVLPYTQLWIDLLECFLTRGCACVGVGFFSQALNPIRDHLCMSKFGERPEGSGGEGEQFAPLLVTLVFFLVEQQGLWNW